MIYHEEKGHLFNFKKRSTISLHERFQKVLPEGIQLRQCWFFLVNEGRDDPNTTKSVPAKMAHADDGPILNAGLVAL